MEELRNKTGRDEDVRAYVMGDENGKKFLEKLYDMLDFLIPRYIAEGKNQLVIGIGCTGGKHRSVTVAGELYSHLCHDEDFGLKLEHRDIDSIYVVNPGNYEICEKIAELDTGKKIRIITNDIVKEQKRLMDEGVIVATIGQQPERQGALPLQILYDYIGLGIVPEEKYYTELTIYIKQNISSAPV